ncbi:MAG TPA: 50S ribosomal protein L15 [Candidatus Sphingobacterium stercoripullorum]|uniref:Large ribosomal subunit protein uL15 n=1 Tax=Candidatus Sphingobacterium stercoripullorum TaxID=2838759 RepID=A0A9D1W7A9_9SPHI|nr:50S ribosomal protein L15 [Candidatus Sphingobacterium stercoripullorum]HLR49899.1 50S ribosomal protein L15 [Candidatus Sphingobacterium stercoripullorum]
MKLHELKPAKGSVKKRKRIGRGEGSGRGGTSTRGHKGAQSRSGYSAKIGFEGGQMPLQRRIPKFGFKNPNRVEYIAVNLDVLQDLVEKHDLKSIDLDTYRKFGLASKNELVKVLARGEFKSKVEIKANAFSKSAQEAIEAAGGSIVKI